MALESIEGAGKYISDLDENYPLSSDPPGTDGDNHLRGIKNTIKNTFPNVNGEVSATHAELNLLDGVTATTTELNYVSGVTSSIQDQLNHKGFSANLSSTTALGGTSWDINTTDISTLTEEYDTDSWFSPSTGRFTPLSSGKYLIVLNVLASSVTAGIDFTGYIKKNGLFAAYDCNVAQSSGLASCSVSVVLDMNGSTDYITFRFAVADASFNLGISTRIQAMKIGS